MTGSRRHEPAAGDARRGRSRWWLVPIALFGLMFAVWGAMIHAALDDPSFAVEPDYYEKGVAWDRHMAQEAENHRLGWTADVATAPSDDGAVRLVVDLNDRHGRALVGAEVQVDTFHNARAARMLHARLDERDAGSYSASLPMRRPGLWEIRLRARRGPERFTHVVKRDVGVER